MFDVGDVDIEGFSGFEVVFWVGCGGEVEDGRGGDCDGDVVGDER